MTPVEMIKRLARQESLRTNVESTWDESERYLMPLSSGSFQMKPSEGSKKWTTREVWDSTAPIGAERLASMVYTSMFSPAFRWFSIGFRNSILNQDREAKAWIESVTDQMFDALSASNFGLEMAAALHSMVVYGNTALTLEPLDPEKWAGLDFAAVPLREIFFEEDHKGRPRVFWRVYSWTALQIVSKFAPLNAEEGAPGNKIPDRIAKAAEAGSDSRFEVVFCCYPREGARAMQAGEGMRAPKERPYAYHYILREGAVELGEEGGYYEMPVFLGRWAKAVGSQWGFGPGTLALPTVKLVNAWLEAMTDAAEKSVDPATLVTERGLLSDLDLKKGGLTTVRSMEDISTYESKARFDVSELMLSDMRNMIRKYFREDDLAMKDSPAMTATEAQLRVELLNRLFGPTTGRIQNDLADPVLQATFNMMYRANQFAPPPAVVLEQNPTMQIEYLGPFMRSQRTDEVAAIERLASGVAALKKMGFEDAGDVFDAVGTVREMAERLAVPAACLRSKQKADLLGENRAKMQQAAAEAQIGKTAAEANRAQAGAEETVRGAQA